MKILFLDIDGVLNHTGGIKLNGIYGIDPDHVALMNLIVKRTGCKIVISSSWRKFHPIEELRELFIEALFDYPQSIIDYTKGFPETYIVRGCEISEWLERHPEVNRYAIVDDDEDFLISQKDNFVRTSANVGLTQLNAFRLISILNRPD